MGMGDIKVQLGAPAPRATRFPQGIPALHPSPGRVRSGAHCSMDSWTFPLSCSPPASCWVENPVYPMGEKIQLFFLPLFSKCSANLDALVFYHR